MWDHTLSNQFSTRRRIPRWRAGAETAGVLVVEAAVVEAAPFEVVLCAPWLLFYERNPPPRHPCTSVFG